MGFVKLNRLRRDIRTRDLISQTQIAADNLIMPYFVVDGRNKKEPIKSMPGVFRFSVDNLTREVKEVNSLGIKAVLLFGVTSKKDARGTGAYSKDGVLQKAIKAIRKNIKDTVIISDVCLCGYTSHGHCGIIKQIIGGQAQFTVDSDKTLTTLSKIALSHAESGADFVAPSAMMDGQVKAIRQTLNKNGFNNVGILAYSAKYASNFYGPFREALDSRPRFGDRRSYQLDFRNSDEALKEIEQDISEGADIVMVKPALAYLDIIQKARQSFHIPIAAYNVSGEYSLIKYGVLKDLFNEKEAVFEILTAIKRAGADLIITYYAKEIAKWLKTNQL